MSDGHFTWEGGGNVVMSLLIAALTLGLIFSVLALGVYISFKIFNIPDITAEGSITLGGAVAAALILAGLAQRHSYSRPGRCSCGVGDWSNGHPLFNSTLAGRHSHNDRPVFGESSVMDRSTTDKF